MVYILRKFLNFLKNYLIKYFLNSANELTSGK